MRLIARIDERALVHRIDADERAEEVGPLRDLKHAWLARGALPFHSHLAGAGERFAA